MTDSALEPRPAGPFRVALTFDAEHPDRPGCPPGNAERILDTLEGSGVRATFFVVGRDVVLVMVVVAAARDTTGG